MVNNHPDILDDHHSYFKWWLAPKKAKIRQGNYQLVRQLDNIYELKMEAIDLKKEVIQEEKKLHKSFSPNSRSKRTLSPCRSASSIFRLKLKQIKLPKKVIQEFPMVDNTVNLSK